jgi:predicted amidohydrolase
VRALLAQLEPAPGDAQANLAALERALAAHPDADIALFPELFLCGYELERARELAAPAEGELIQRVRRAAAERATAVVVGFAETTQAGTIANAAVCVDCDGTLAGVYRKTHLFAERERQAFEPGDELLLVPLAGRLVAPLVCFDMEFPEPARALCRAGAELLVTISANMAPYGPDHALAARARALENRRAHLYVNRVGCAHGLEFVGESCAIDAAGRVTLGAGSSERLLEVEVPETSAADADVDYLQHARGELPVRAAGVHRGEWGWTQ